MEGGRGEREVIEICSPIVQVLQHCCFEQGLGNAECFLLLAWEFSACVHLNVYK